MQHETGTSLLDAIRTPTDHLSVGADGILAIDGVPVTGLIERFGSPLQVAVERTIRANYRNIKRAFEARWPAPVNVMYSIKCNNSLAIRAILSSEGAGGDCFGLGELYATLTGGADPRLIVMNGSNKSFDEVAAAVALGITINVDSEDEITFLREAAGRIGKRARVNLRLKVLPDALDDHITDAYRTPEGAIAGVRRAKWGFTPDAAVALVKILSSIDGIELRGYSAHIGHQSNRPEAFADIAEAVVEAAGIIGQATGFTPSVLDLGGGWAQVREPSARQFSINPFTIDDYAEAATGALRRGLGRETDLPELWLEPGRYITSNGQLLLASVGSIKRDAGYTWVHVDASTNDLPRIESGRHWYHILPATRMSDDMVAEMEIVGGTCFKSVIGAGRRLPALRRRDILAVLDTGMYAEVFANQFNGVPRPATVLLSEGGVELVRRREDIADVFASHLVPSRLSATAPRHTWSATVLKWAESGFREG